jgi:hypothetical protein
MAGGCTLIVHRFGTAVGGAATILLDYHGILFMWIIVLYDFLVEV